MHALLISVGQCLWITSLYLGIADVLDMAATAVFPQIFLLHKALAILFAVGCLFIPKQSYRIASAMTCVCLALTLVVAPGWQVLANILFLVTVIVCISFTEYTGQRPKIWGLPALLVTFVFFGHLHFSTSQHTPTDTESPFLPALMSTPSMAHLSVDELNRDDECRECHRATHAQWLASAHRFSSFNNPAYRFSVLETRAKLVQRDGHSRAARLCAGCHDPVALLTGAFDEETFDLPHEQSNLGVTCLTCHATTAVTTTRGNASLEIEPLRNYPFAGADAPILRWLHDKTLQSTPAFHKASLLKPLHRDPAFCGACHKVHLPKALNDYRWLRGQNHYDSFLQSGISGQSARSYYYPKKAVSSCTGCHMRNRGIPTHQFPGANTALPALMPDLLSVSAATIHEQQLKDAVTVDILSVRPRDGTSFYFPPDDVPLKPGGEYVAEIVLANRRVGHHFTQGTTDSNQVWLEVTLRQGDKILGQNGAMDDERRVDRAAYFVNSYQLDREGQRIDRRNAQDIYAPLYDHQIPPGSADVVQFAFTLPRELSIEAGSPIQLTARLNYRKFDSHYIDLITGEANLLPVTEISSDRVTFGEARERPDETWRRLNDYGIALLRKPGGRAQTRAIVVFEQVARLNPAHGHLNLARAKFAAGDLSGAHEALNEARLISDHPWTVTWLEGELALAGGDLDGAIRAYARVASTEFKTAQERGFDFSGDYTLRNRLASAYFLRAIQQGNEADFQHAISHYKDVLSLDSENAEAHFGLAQIYSALKHHVQAEHHIKRHETYRIDEQALARVRAIARQNPLLDQAADPLNIYRLR